jgi:hypothetical protein
MRERRGEREEREERRKQHVLSCPRQGTQVAFLHLSELFALNLHPAELIFADACARVCSSVRACVRFHGCCAGLLHSIKGSLQGLCHTFPPSDPGDAHEAPDCGCATAGDPLSGPSSLEKRQLSCQDLSRKDSKNRMAMLLWF